MANMVHSSHRFIGSIGEQFPLKIVSIVSFKLSIVPIVSMGDFKMDSSLDL